jgi:hypothetical protein
MPDRQRLLELALTGLQAEQAKIDDEIAQIKSQLNQPAVAKGGGGGTNLPTSPLPAKRTMSAAARKKISEAMKRRYAEINKAAAKTDSPSHAASQVRKAGSVGPKQSTGKKENGGDRLTAAGRKKLSDLMKKRWADKRKGKK